MPFLSGKCTSKVRLDGKTAVVTGCNTGIGKETVHDFVLRGCRVIMACRDVVKAEDAAEEIRKATSGVEGVGVIVVVRLDLSSFASVKECADKLLKTETQINILVNNGGVMMCPKGKTEDGFETQLAVNHLSHFLFTLLLLPVIRKSTPARIVVVSSLAHEQSSGINFDDINGEKSYSASSAYAQSKLANVLFAKELAIRLESRHPGHNHVLARVVDTNLYRNLDSALFSGMEWINKHLLSHAYKTPKQGAQTTIHCAVDEHAGEETGLYYSDCVKKKPSCKARDAKMAARLWDESIKMVGIGDPVVPLPSSIAP